MPNTKAAKKALRQAVKRTAHNLQIKQAIEYYTKMVKKAVENKKIEEAQKFFKDLQKIVDKAAKKNVVRKNTAGRRKARLMKKINSLKK